MPEIRQRLKLIHIDETAPVCAKLKEYAEERSVLLRRLKASVTEDRRISAAWIFGSLARGDEDELSDIDVMLVIDQCADAPFLAEQDGVVGALGEPIMVLDAPQNRPPGGGYCMAWYGGIHGPHAVDWSWSPAATVRIPTGVKVIHNRGHLEASSQPMEFDHQPVPERDRREEVRQTLHGFWSMLLIVAKHAARKPYEERMGLLQWTVPQLREAQQFVGRQPGASFVDLPSHPLPSEKISLLRSFASEASELTNALAKRRVVAPTKIEPNVEKYLNLVETVMLATEKM